VGRPGPGPGLAGRPGPGGRHAGGPDPAERERGGAGPYPDADRPARPAAIGSAVAGDPAALGAAIVADPPSIAAAGAAGPAALGAAIVADPPGVGATSASDPAAIGASIAADLPSLTGSARPISPAGPRPARPTSPPGPAGPTDDDLRDRGLSPSENFPDLDLGLDRDPSTEIKIDPLFSGTREIRTGRRADLRRQLNEVRRMRTATVILLVLAVLGAPLGFYALREAARDPVFGDLAALEVPGWAARDARDEALGSRWCIGQCRLRQRIMRSERSPQETAAVYTAALRKAGWAAWPVEGCHTDDEDGVESCWQRDEYVLDLWIYQPECEVQLKAPTDAPSGVPGDAPAGGAQAEAVCPPTVVTLKVINRVGYQDRTGAER